ncbi:MAG: DUF167 domain-containing protein [bacterium]|nr:DUF167 domain-containing protein [bacterium]
MPESKVDKVTIHVKVITNAGQTEIVGWQGDFLKIKIIVVPDKGKANLELISFLAKMLDINKSDIEIVRGKKNHRKIISLPRKAGAMLKGF